MPRQVHIRVSWANDLAYFHRLNKALELDGTIKNKKLKKDIMRALQELCLLIQKAESTRVMANVG